MKTNRVFGEFLKRPNLPRINRAAKKLLDKSANLEVNNQVANKPSRIVPARVISSLPKYHFTLKIKVRIGYSIRTRGLSLQLNAN